MYKMEETEMKKIKELEKENATLKQQVKAARIIFTLIYLVNMTYLVVNCIRLYSDDIKGLVAKVKAKFFGRSTDIERLEEIE